MASNSSNQKRYTGSARITMPTTCAQCGVEASLLCGGCGDVAYCCKDHQKADWKAGHKAKCKAYKVAQHSVYGRHLVTSRDVKAGGRLLCKNQPIVVGPPMTHPRPLCIGCHGGLEKRKSPLLKCTQCAFPFCTPKCLHSESSEECRRLSDMLGGQICYEPILPMRLLCVKVDRPELYSRLLTELQSHREELKASEKWADLQRKVVGPLAKAFKDTSEDELATVVGILATNAFEVVARSGVEPVIGLFEVASLMNHDCIGNTRLVIDEDLRMTIYASVALQKGAPILFNYVRPLDATWSRRENLQQYKFFTCQCKRCQDPTELDTFCGALLCTSCGTGPVVADPLKSDVWTCHDCHEDMEVSRARLISDQAEAGRKKLSAAQARMDLVATRNLLKEFCNKLYPWNGFLHEIRQVLVTCTAAAVNNPGLHREADMHRERLGWCSQILQSLDVLEPGLSLSRGMTLYEKQSSMVRLANLIFEQDTSRAKGLLDTLLEANQMLMEARKCLELEPASSPMSKYVKVIEEDFKELTNYIEMVRELV